MARRRGRSYARSGYYKMTPARKAALRKAQIASAQKRKRNRRVRNAALTGVGIGAVAGAVVARHKFSKSKLSVGVHRNPREGERITTTNYHPLRFDSHGFRAGGGQTRVTSKLRSPAHIGVSRQGNRWTMTARPLRGRPALRVGYTHNPIRGSKTAAKVSIPVRRQEIERDQIPFYNKKTSRSWPHLSPKSAREVNKRLRELGMLE